MTSADGLRVLRHMADVAALRSDPVQQRQHLIDGLNDMLGTTSGWLYAIDDYRPGRAIRYRTQVLTSAPDPLWAKYITEFGVKHPITDDPYATAILHDNRRRQVWTMNSVLPDEAARARYAPVMDLIREMNVTDGLVAAARLGPEGDNVVGFSLQCLRGAPRLSKREYEMALLAIGELGRMAEKAAVQFGPPAITDLPPRLQQILIRLRDGRSAKEIAGELQISVHTVREHLQRLYLRYDVTSREALMAKFVSG